jgi:hypothetical protein
VTPAGLCTATTKSGTRCTRVSDYIRDGHFVCASHYRSDRYEMFKSTKEGDVGHHDHEEGRPLPVAKH